MTKEDIDWADYAAKARAFSSYANGTGKERSPDHIHCATLGLSGETGETIERVHAALYGVPRYVELVKICEELGDVLWYIVELGEAFGISLATIALASRPPPLYVRHGAQGRPEIGSQFNTAMAVSASKAADYIKKVCHHKHTMDVERLVQMLADVFGCVKALSDMFGFQMEDVAASNLTKLRKRYPEGQFTTERSINRED